MEAPQFCHITQKFGKQYGGSSVLPYAPEISVPKNVPEGM
jgi:hypothetical protein